MAAPLDRRRFLLGTGGLALAGLGAAPAGAQKREPVIVIGAGISGLACASELTRLGFEVMVLEGRSRIGGRIWTDERLGFPADLGASMLMGYAHNPVTKIARAAGAEVVPTDWDSLAAYYKGKRVPDQELDETAEGATELMTRLEKLSTSLPSDIPLSAAVDRVLAGEKLTPAEQRGRDLVLSILELDSAADLDELGTSGQEPPQNPDGDDALVKGGYVQVPRHLARGLKVLTDHIVTRIQHGPTGVMVETNQGRFEAKRCVVSLPLGVLQSGKVVFSPALPEDKQGAIRRLGMGTLDKVVLALPRRILPKGADYLGRIGDEQRRFPLFMDLERISGRPAMLGFVGGKLARSLEKKSDAEVIAQALRSLRDALGETVPEPTAATVVRWSLDPFSCGSYSYTPVGAKDADRDTLATPVGEELFFCGEATARNQCGTVHGAYLSGLHAAARVAGANSPGLSTQAASSAQRRHQSRMSGRKRKK